MPLSDPMLTFSFLLHLPNHHLQKCCSLRFQVKIYETHTPGFLGHYAPAMTIATLMLTSPTNSTFGEIFPLSLRTIRLDPMDKARYLN